MKTPNHSPYDVAQELIDAKIPHTFTVKEAAKLSPMFKDRRIGNILSKMTQSYRRKLPVSIKKVGRAPKGIIWEWEQNI